MSLVITLSQIFSPSPIWKNKFPFWRVTLTGPYPFLGLSPFPPLPRGREGQRLQDPCLHAPDERDSVRDDLVPLLGLPGVLAGGLAIGEVLVDPDREFQVKVKINKKKQE